MTKQAFLEQMKSGRLAIQAPYDGEFVSALKAETQTRQWNGDFKVWTVEPAEADAAIAITARYFDVVDARKMSKAQVEDAKLSAEIRKIQADQAWILENRAWFEEAIEALDGDVRTYSARSSSGVKARKAHDAALFGHALRYAAQPVESLTEMQVRSLSAARKIAETETLTSLLARS